MTEHTPAAEPATPYRYTAELAARVEEQWQSRWAREGTFNSPNPVGDLADPARIADRSTKVFVLDMFPYPSGVGLHVGHPLGYIATDAYARYQRMCGANVLHTLGYDSFGLPAEQYAVQTGQHPRVTTDANVVNMRRQLGRLGLGHDPRRSVATTDVDFYRWTQWIFLQVYNSWYDPEAVNRDGGHGRARPISELVAEFAVGTRSVAGVPGAGDATAWTDLDAAAQHQVIDGFRLAYLSNAPVNWCPGLGTVLANEEVNAEGRSDRGDFPVFKRNLRQWKMRITAYSDRLISDLDRLDWPEPVKLMQRNWIGRSTGAQVRFATMSGDIEVFTTRPDTLFGATFMVLAPEHPMVDELIAEQWPTQTHAEWTGGYSTPADAVVAYRADAAARTDQERSAESKVKTGVFIGAFATNPTTGASIPVFIADYVLMGYGTGAIMAVPGQDQRDWDFAETFDLPIVRTVQPAEGWDGKAFTGEGPAINSANAEISLNGLDIGPAKAAIIAWLQAKGRGTEAITYKLRDWLFSRQRYWGEPFPIVYDEAGQAHALPDSMLPLELPEVSDYAPRTFEPDDAKSNPEPPLSKERDWVEVELDLGNGLQRYTRDSNVMPQWAGSCWYELRYLDPTNKAAFVDPVVEQYWMGPRPDPRTGEVVVGGDPGGVDLYVGGVEHAVLHLLYSRFWHKVLYDLGHVSSAEPFRKLFNQGYIQAYAYRDDRGFHVEAAEVVADSSSPTGYLHDGAPVTREYGKMGKSLKNSVTPDDMFAEYGADTLRLYEMAMGPLDVSRPWDTRAVIGSFRFLQRLWRNVVSEETGEALVSDQPGDEATRRIMHRTIDAVGHEYAELRFNTAIARLTEFNNHLTPLAAVPREAAEALVLMVAPLAPHAAEELWKALGHPQSLTYEPFPTADPDYLVEETVTCVVQIAGKVRDRLEVAPTIDEASLEAMALAAPAVVRAIDGRPIRKVIVRAPKLVNIVLG